MERKYHGTTSDPFDAYEYNLQGRLSLFTPDGQTAIAYKYDPSGIRVQRTAAAATTSYLVDPYNPTGYAQTLIEDNGTTRITKRSDPILFGTVFALCQLNIAFTAIVGIL